MLLLLASAAARRRACACVRRGGLLVMLIRMVLVMLIRMIGDGEREHHTTSALPIARPSAHGGNSDGGDERGAYHRSRSPRDSLAGRGATDNGPGPPRPAAAAR